MPMFPASLYAATNQRRPADTRSITRGRRTLPHDYVSDDTVGCDLLIVYHAVEDVAPVHSKAFLFRTPPKPAFPLLCHAHITAACLGAIRSGIGHSLMPLKHPIRRGWARGARRSGSPSPRGQEREAAATARAPGQLLVRELTDGAHFDGMAFIGGQCSEWGLAGGRR